MLGGFWAVEHSQRDSTGTTPALNAESAAFYALMIAAYAALSLGIRRWRQPGLPAFERRVRAAAEAFLVAFVGAPLVLLAVVLRALSVGDLGR